MLVQSGPPDRRPSAAILDSPILARVERVLLRHDGASDRDNVHIQRAAFTQVIDLKVLIWSVFFKKYACFELLSWSYNSISYDQTSFLQKKSSIKNLPSMLIDPLIIYQFISLTFAIYFVWL